MSDRDLKIDQKATELHASKCAGWEIAAANAFIADIGRSAQDDAFKAARGVYASNNGWPVTTRNGARVCLQHVVDVGGKAAFMPAK